MPDNIVTPSSPNGDQLKPTKDLSNLRAIREILSYIHVDAVQDDYREVAERIEFAMSAAENTLKKEMPQIETEETVAKPVVLDAKNLSQTIVKSQ